MPEASYRALEKSCTGEAKNEDIADAVHVQRDELTVADTWRLGGDVAPGRYDHRTGNPMSYTTYGYFLGFEVEINNICGFSLMRSIVSTL